MEFIYRTAQIDDSSEIARLSGQLGYPVEAGQVHERLKIILGNNDNVVYVAELQNKLIGWVHAHGRYLLESEPFIEIGGLVVDSDFRGLSIGKNLMSYCEEWAKSLGFKRIRVRSNTNRPDAHHFYSRIGYKNVKSQQVFNKEL